MSDNIKKIMCCLVFVVILSNDCLIFAYELYYSNDIVHDANAGDAKAQYLLGTKYYWGDGLSQDYRQAFFGFQKAAEQNNADAQEYL